MPLKVIGASYGRTGTTSTQAALELLGFGRCYHGDDLFNQPSHIPLWRAALRGQPIDWEQLLGDCQSIIDWPGCMFYQELMQRYPEAKVLLTVRDPERWYTSVHKTIYTARQLQRHPLLRIQPWTWQPASALDDAIWEGTFHGRFADKAYALEVYHRRVEEVQRVVPPERLLVFDVAQGWEPLCAFLGVPVPAGLPFPHLKDMRSYQVRISRYRWGLNAVAGIGILTALMLARRLLLRAH